MMTTDHEDDGYAANNRSFGRGAVTNREFAAESIAEKALKMLNVLKWMSKSKTAKTA